MPARALIFQRWASARDTDGRGEGLDRKRLLGEASPGLQPRERRTDGAMER